MTLESLSAYFDRSTKKRTLKLIYLGYSLEQLVLNHLKQTVRIVIRPTRVLIYCQDQPTAAYLELNIGQLRQLVGRVLKPPPAKISLKVEADRAEY